VFCEVKSRTGDRFGQPVEAVTPVKQAKIRRLAARWLREHPVTAGARRADLRFDVATVLGDRLDVLESAF
jgi:putative endonuclease